MLLRIEICWAGGGGGGEVAKHSKNIKKSQVCKVQVQVLYLQRQKLKRNAD
jgi:hypothetical protein